MNELTKYNTEVPIKKDKVSKTKPTRGARYSSRVKPDIPEHERVVAIPAVDYKFRARAPLNCHITKTI